MNMPKIISYVALWIIVICLSFLMLLVFRQFGLVYLKSSAEGVSKSGVALNTKIPDLELTTNLGMKIKLSELKQPTVLLFTSPHCAPCQKLIEKLNDYIIEYPLVNIILMSIDHKSDDPIPQLRCPVVPLPNRDMYTKVFEGEVTPYGFLIDENRKVLSKGLINDPKSIEFLIQTSKSKSIAKSFYTETVV